MRQSAIQLELSAEVLKRLIKHQVLTIEEIQCMNQDSQQRVKQLMLLSLVK